MARGPTGGELGLRRKRRERLLPPVDTVLRAAFYLVLGLAVVGLGAVDRFVFAIVAFGVFGIWLAASLLLTMPPRLARCHAVINWAILAVLGLTAVQIIPWPAGSLLNPIFSQPLLGGGHLGSITANPSATISACLAIIMPLAGMSTSMLLHQNEIAAVRFIRRGALLGGLIIGLSLIQFMALPDTLLLFRKMHYRDSFTATFVNRNTAATFCGIVLLLATTLTLNDLAWQRGGHSVHAAPVSRSTWSEWALRLVIPVAAVGLALTRSRAGVSSTLVPLIAVLALYGYSVLRSQKLTLGRAGRAILIAAGLLAIGVLILDQLLDRFEAQGANSARWCVYGTMLNAFLDRPWLGIGLGGFETFYPMRRDPACGIYGEWEYLHSVYLEILLSGGVVFFLFALALIIWMARLFFSGYMRRRGFRVVPLAGGAVLMLVLLHSILDFSVQIPGIGLVVAAIFGSVMPIASRSPRRRAERYSVNIVLKD